MDPSNSSTSGDEASDPADIVPPLMPATSDDGEALARLRDALIASEPMVAPELVQAGSVAELERTFAAAKAAAQRARDMTIAASAPRISSGAPGRTQYTPATPFEKIRTGLQNRI